MAAILNLPFEHVKKKRSAKSPLLLAVMVVLLALAMVTESASPSATARKLCAANQYKCRDGSCILREKMCDGRHDCPDNTDELDCDAKLCRKPDWFQCAQPHGACLTAELICNGIENCVGGEDETDCVGPDRQRTSLDVGTGGWHGAKRNCSDFEYTCQTDKSCIPLDFMCDGKRDCHDGSDEIAGCLKAAANCAGFYCDNHKCLELKSWVCDGVDDCGDGSDEHNCTTNCTLQMNGFMCTNNSTCLKLSQVCDGKVDCNDGSDESPRCSTARNNCKTMTCPPAAKCQMLPTIGAECICPKGFRFSSLLNTCQDIDECIEHYDTCSQYCENTSGSYKCTCDDGYTLDAADNHSCRVHDATEPLLLYTTQVTVMGVHLNSKRIFTVANNLSKVIGVAYDDEHIYWTSIQHEGESIVRANTDGSEQEILLTSGLDAPEDLAVDWLTDNIYFSDNVMRHIAVCSNDGMSCVVLVTIDVHHPRGIALWPQRGQMFWTDWGSKPMIVRASMDGSYSLPLVTENIRWPNGIALDMHNNRLYWVDAKTGKMESVRPDGTDRRVVLEGMLKHPYGIAVFEDRLFWSDWGTKSVHECNKFTGKNHKVVVKDRTIYAVHVYHPSKQPKVRHACQNARCSHLCLLTENNSFSCACPDGMQLSADQHRCVTIHKKQRLYIGLRNTLLEMEHTAFGRHVVTKTHQLPYYINEITYNSVNNSVIIADNVQRTIIEFEPTTNKMNTLAVGNLANVTGLAFDHLAHTVYWTDSERHVVEVLSLNTRSRAIVSFFSGIEAPVGIAVIPTEGCMFIALRSRRYMHIDRLELSGRGDHKHAFEEEIGDDDIKFVTDHDSHTLYWSDSDIGRISFTDYRNLHPYTFRGRLRRPYSMALVDTDIFWTELKSSSIYWTHKSNMGALKRIEIEAMHTAPHFPERIPLSASIPAAMADHPCQHMNGGCSHVCVTKTKFTSSCMCPAGFVFRDSSNRTCIEALDCEFRCQSGECLTMSHRCNGRKDCPDGSDEEGCDAQKKRPKVICSISEFTCHDGEHCVNSEKRCDGHKDCHDSSDEKHCEHFDKDKRCHRHQHACDNGKCVDLSVLCDGTDDCGDHSDESKCKHTPGKAASVGDLRPSCGKNMFQCDVGTCIARSWECDGKIDCIDSSDEHDKCGLKECDLGMHKCLLGQCIDEQLVCDGHNDCGDKSDELNCDLMTGVMQKKLNISCGDEEMPMYQCPSNMKVCLELKAKCNGTAECPRGEDEADCGDSCSIYEFQCKESKSCIRKEFRCDHEKDCPDGSDEVDCDHFRNGTSVVTTAERACRPNMFDCMDGECVDMSRVCNGFPDCETGIDEGTQCTTACKSSSNKPICEHKCRPTPTGAVCSCFEGYKLDANLRACVDINECVDMDPCAQLCENTHGSYNCQCYPDFMLRQDRITCKSIESGSTLFFTTYNEVRSMSEQPITLRVAWSANESEITGFDINVHMRRAYFTNDNEDVLYMVDMNNGRVEAGLNVQAPSKVAIDWITDNVYVISHAQSYEINVCSFSTKMCGRIVAAKPRVTIKALTVDAFNRHLFYVTIRSESFGQLYSQITIAALDGSKRELLHRKYTGYITALTTDPHKQILYFVDMHTKTLEMITYKPGIERTSRVLIQKSNAITQPSGLSLYENHAYIVNIGAKEVVRCQLYAQRKCKSYNLNIFNAQDITVDGISRQPLGKNPCALAKCTGSMCVQAEYGYECMCGNNVVGESEFCDKSHANDIVYGALLSHEARYDVINAGQSDDGNATHTASIVVTIGLLVIALFGAVAGYIYYRRSGRGHRDFNVNLHFQNPLATLSQKTSGIFERTGSTGSNISDDTRSTGTGTTGTTAASFVADRETPIQFGKSAIQRFFGFSSTTSANTLGTEIHLETATGHPTTNEVQTMAKSKRVQPRIVVDANDECEFDAGGMLISSDYASDDPNAKLVP